MIDTAQQESEVSYQSYLVDQNWDQYSSEQHDTWKSLFKNQAALLKSRACPEFLQGLDLLGITENNIPNFERMNERLMKITGWQVVPTSGLVPSRPFFDMLAEKKFPAGTFIRTPEQIDYLEEPDIFHDVYGHIPLLTNPAFANYMYAYGQAGDDALKNNAVKYLARLNWYTIEFGLIRQDGDLKIYGAGIASSFGETKYALDAPSPNYIEFNLERILRTGYYIDDLQSTYFVVDSFDQLFEECVERPFVPLYEQLKDMPDLTPFEICDDDKVIREGSGEYWKDFAQTKSKLK